MEQQLVQLFVLRADSYTKWHESLSSLYLLQFGQPNRTSGKSHRLAVPLVSVSPFRQNFVVSLADVCICIAVILGQTVVVEQNTNEASRASMVSKLQDGKVPNLILERCIRYKVYYR